MLYLVFTIYRCLHPLFLLFFPCPQSEGLAPQRQSILPWNVKQTRGADYLFAINVYSLWCEQAYPAGMCVCVCVPESEHVWDWLRVCMYVQICVNACSWGGGSRQSPLGQSRVEHGSGSVQWSDVYPVQQRRRSLSSQADHRHIFRWARQKRCSAGLLWAATAGVKCVWLSQSFCQSFFHFTVSCRGAVGRHGGMAGVTNPPLNLSKGGWALNSLVDIHTWMHALT